jgi:hypothetical protein
LILWIAADELRLRRSSLGGAPGGDQSRQRSQPTLGSGLIAGTRDAPFCSGVNADVARAVPAFPHGFARLVST